MVEPDRMPTMAMPCFFPFFGLANFPMPPMFEMAMAFMNNMMTLAYPMAANSNFGMSSPFAATPQHQPAPPEPAASVPLARPAFDHDHLQALVNTLVEDKTREIIDISKRIESRASHLESELVRLRAETMAANDALAARPSAPPPAPVDLSGLANRIGRVEAELTVLRLAQSTPKDTAFEQKRLESRFLSLESAVAELHTVTAKNSDDLKYAESAMNDMTVSQNRMIESRFTLIDKALTNLQQAQILMQTTLGPKETAPAPLATDSAPSDERLAALDARIGKVELLTLEIEKLKELYAFTMRQIEDSTTEQISEATTSLAIRIDQLGHAVTQAHNLFNAGKGIGIEDLHQMEDTILGKVAETNELYDKRLASLDSMLTDLRRQHSEKQQQQAMPLQPDANLTARIDQLNDAMAQVRDMFDLNKATASADLRQTELSLLGKMTETGTGLAARLDFLDGALADLRRERGEAEQNTRKNDLDWDEKLREVQLKIENRLAEYKATISDLVQDEVLSVQKVHANEKARSAALPAVSEDIETRVRTVERLITDSNELQNELLSAIEEAFVALFRKNVLKMTDLAKPVQDRLTARLTSLCLTPVIAADQSKA